MKAIPFILENLLNFTILFAGIWLIKMLFRNKISAQMHYLIWVIVVLKLLLPFGLPSVASPWAWISGQPATAAVQNEYEAYVPPVENNAALYENTVSINTDNLVPADVQPAPVNESADAGPAPRMPLRINWNVVILSIWLSGIAARLTWLMLKNRSFRKKLLTNEINPSYRIRKCFRSCLKETDITKEVRLIVQDAYPVPMVTGCFKPALILPKSVLWDRDSGRLRHVMAHEMAHIARKDTLVVSLLNILSAVYWFNPLVWLCFKLIRADMETACDCMAIRALGKAKRQDYIETVMRFAGRSDTPRLRAAMGISMGSPKARGFWGKNKGHRNMERRIRGMFLKAKTKGRVKAPVAILACILAFACFTTACQPTPEVPVVINKGDGQLANEIDATPAPKEKYEAPAQYKQEAQSFYDGMLSVSFDMQVETPDVDAYPVYTVKDADFTQQQVDRIVSALMQDKALKYYDEELTKQEITEIFLLPEKKRLLEAKNGKAFSDDGGNISTGQIENNIKMFEQWVENAPETKDEHSVTAEEYTTTGTLSAMANLGESRPATLKIARAGQTFYNMQFINGTEYIYNGFSEPTGDLPLKTTKEQAVAIAAQLISDMGAEDFRLAAVGKTTRLGSEYDIDSEEYQNTMAYSVVFTRTVDGIPLTYTPIDSIGIMEKEKMDAQTWSYERIMVNIDDNGVANVFWDGNIEIGACVNENVRLMKFEDIAARAMDQIKIQNAFLTDQNKEGEGIHIERLDFDISMAKLGFARIRVKDSAEYQIVPVWDFFGSTTYYRDENEIDAFNKKHGVDLQAIESYDIGYRAIITINAIDGSAIDRNLGY